MPVIRRLFNHSYRFAQLTMAGVTEGAAVSLTEITRIGAVVIPRRLIAEEDGDIHRLQCGLNSGGDKFQQLRQSGHRSQGSGQLSDDLLRVVRLAEESPVNQWTEEFLVQVAGDFPDGDTDCGGDQTDHYHRRPKAAEDVCQEGGDAEADGDHIQKNRPARNQHVTDAAANDQADGYHLMPDDGIGE